MRVVVRDGCEYKRVRIFVCPQCSNVVLSDSGVEVCDNCDKTMSSVDGHYYIPRWVYEHPEMFEWRCTESLHVEYREKEFGPVKTNKWERINDFDL